MIQVPAHVQPFVDVLGAEDAVRFLLAFGGTGMYLPAQRAHNSAAVDLIGAEQTVALGKRLGGGNHKIPTAKRWIAQYLRFEQRLSIAEICRQLHMTEPTVRGYVEVEETNRRQGNLFEK